jgi:hypothetical protein
MMTNDEAIAAATAAINEALRRNRYWEMGIGLVLLTLFVSGLYLLFSGFSASGPEMWSRLIAGGLIEGTIYWPVRELIRLRRENIALQVIPSLLRLAKSAEGKQLVLKLLYKLLGSIRNGQEKS